MRKIVTILSLLLLVTSVEAAKNKFHGKFVGRQLGGDSIVFRLFDTDKLISLNDPIATYTFPIAEDGSFSIEFDKPKQSIYHFEFIIRIPIDNKYLQLNSVLFARRFLIEAGKDINLNVDFSKNTAVFMGLSRDILNCQLKINEVKRISPESFKEVTEESFTQYIEEDDRLNSDKINKKLEILFSKQFNVSNKLKELIKQDLIGYDKFIFARAVAIQYAVGSKIKKSGISAYFFKNQKLESSMLFNIDSLSSSPWHIEYLMKLEMLRMQANKSIQEVPQTFDYIFSQVKNYKGYVHDKMLVALYIDNSKKSLDKAMELAPSVIENMGNNWCKDFLINWRNKMSVGAKTFGFSFLDRNGKTVRLDDFKNKVILIDFWFHGCSGCIQIVPSLSKIIDKFEGRKDVEFLSINIDKYEKSWIAGLNLGIYSDKRQIHLNTGETGYNHPFISHYNILSYPHLFIIGKNGQIISTSPTDPRKDDGKEIIRLIEAAL